MNVESGPAAICTGMDTNGKNESKTQSRSRAQGVSKLNKMNKMREREMSAD